MACIYGLREQTDIQNATCSFQAQMNYCVCDTHPFLNNSFRCQDTEKHFPLKGSFRPQRKKDSNHFDIFDRFCSSGGGRLRCSAETSSL